MEDIIITVLALALGLAFKVIEKKLKSAGKPSKARRVKELADLFGEGEAEVFPPVAPLQEQQEEPDEQPEPVSQPVIVDSPVTVSAAVEEAPRSVLPTAAPILQEEEVKTKEKIDPKKLVVYSEIMKPKCLE